MSEQTPWAMQKPYKIQAENIGELSDKIDAMHVQLQDQYMAIMGYIEELELYLKRNRTPKKKSLEEHRERLKLSAVELEQKILAFVDDELMLLRIPAEITIMRANWMYADWAAVRIAMQHLERDGELIRFIDKKGKDRMSYFITYRAFQVKAEKLRALAEQKGLQSLQSAQESIV